jgi:uncharacterized protein (UPF0548 family)
VRFLKSVFFLRRPSDQRIREFLADQKDRPFSYQEVGATRERAPHGYNVAHRRVQLGSDEDVFESAKAAIREWKMFAMPWIQLCWPAAPIEAGTTVGVLVSHFGFWSVNAARIVYTIDESDESRRFGFAYGTLDGHAEIGEERFTVEFQADQTVWYEIYAFSRPRGLALWAYPISRALQKRFGRDSMLAMQCAVSGDAQR